MAEEQLVYGANLTFPADAGPTPEDMRDEIWRWARRESPGDWSPGQHEDGGRLVTAREASRGEQRLWQVELHHADSDVTGLGWQARAAVVVDGAHRTLMTTVHQTREAGVGQEVEPGPPLIVRWAITHGAMSTRIPLSPPVAEIAGRDAVDELVEGWLRDADRVVPVVVFTPFSGRPGVYALTRPGIEDFAQSVAGIARVVCIPDPEDTFRLTDQVGQMLRVFNGSTRVYWPQIETGVHPLHLPARMNRFVIQSVATSIRRRNVQLFREPPQIRTLLAYHARVVERAEMEARLEAARGVQEQAASLQKEVVDLRRHVDEAGDHVASLESEIAQRDVRITELAEAHSLYQARMAARLAEEDPLVVRARTRREIGGTVISRLRELLQQMEEEVGEEAAAAEASTAEGEEQVESYVPTDYAEAILMAAEYFAGTMDITKAAEDQAMNMQLERVSAAKLWEALQALDAVVTLWQQDQLPSGGMAEALRMRGYQVGRVSQTALGKYRHEYEFTYDNRRVYVDPHIRLGQRNRIYWYQTGENERRFIINHIGLHLSDGTSG